MGLNKILSTLASAIVLSGPAMAQDQQKITAREVIVALGDATPAIKTELSAIVATAKRCETILQWDICANSQTGPAAVAARFPEQGQWNDIFEKNAKLSPDLKKTEQQAWKQVPGMMDAFDDWLEAQEEKAKKVVIAADQENAGKKEVVIAADVLLARKEFLIKLTAISSITDPAITSIKKQLSEGWDFYSLTQDPMLKSLFMAWNIPPVDRDWLQLIAKWFDANKIT
jgi:hypothetical protein